MMRSMADFDVKKFFLSWRMWLVVLAILSFLWGVPKLQVGQVDDEDEVRIASLEDEYRRTLAQILGGLALLYGLHLTQRRVVATEEGQITERFTQAIQQLGDDKMAIRLGGIYALERIAKDSKKDHGPIMEVLTAYVREKAIQRGKYAEEAAEEPTTDIQAILTVIGRRKIVKTEKVKVDDFLHLSNTHLAGVMLITADLSRVLLGGANLSGAKLQRAGLSRAMLSGANLSGAKLQGADLQGADLNGVSLSGADLSGAKLVGSKNLTAEQVKSAKNWDKADLPDYLQYLLTEQSAPPA